MWGCAYVDGDGADGEPVDLTGYTIAAQLRTADGDVALDLSAGVDAGAGGTFTLSADAADTARLEELEYLCDVRLESAGGEVYYSDTFIVRVVAEVTH